MIFARRVFSSKHTPKRNHHLHTDKQHFFQIMNHSKFCSFYRLTSTALIPLLLPQFALTLNLLLLLKLCHFDPIYLIFIFSTMPGAKVLISTQYLPDANEQMLNSSSWCLWRRWGVERMCWKAFYPEYCLKIQCKRKWFSRFWNV